VLVPAKSKSSGNLKITEAKKGMEIQAEIQKFVEEVVSEIMRRLINLKSCTTQLLW
jgi:hypothetical protein